MQPTHAEIRDTVQTILEVTAAKAATIALLIAACVALRVAAGTSLQDAVEECLEDVGLL